MVESRAEREIAINASSEMQQFSALLATAPRAARAGLACRLEDVAAHVC